jgi:hypothetical protein
MPRLRLPKDWKQKATRAPSNLKLRDAAAPRTEGYVSLNIFPLALKTYPCRFLHFLNSLGLFFSCSNADATTSALGMSGSVATEKHVDLPLREIRSTDW